MNETRPVLWQIGVSHFSEKARWALDHKRAEHVRRSPPPGVHIPVALWLTRGESYTFPVLSLEGRGIGDSTAVLAAIEARFPEPPLYPADPERRRRALELEDFFDEELGPYSRLLAFHELIGEPEIFAELASRMLPGPLGRAKRLTGAYARAFTSLRYGASSEEATASARAKILAALERLEAELAAGDGEFLVGEELSVADITAASLFYPVIAPPGSPLPPDQPRPPALERFRASIGERPGLRWVERTYRRHRHPKRAAIAAR